MGRINYTEFEGGFNQVVLEESFVMNLKTTMSFVDFTVNFAVNPNYPLYVAPEPLSRPAPSGLLSNEGEYRDYWEDEENEAGYPEGEDARASTMPEPGTESDANASTDEVDDAIIQYPYRSGRIFFPNMEQVRWISRIQPFIDPSTGSVDYGAIDYFYRDESDGRYYLAGYWGELDILCGPPILEIDELKQHQQSQQAQKSHSPQP